MVEESAQVKDLKLVKYLLRSIVDTYEDLEPSIDEAELYTEEIKGKLEMIKLSHSALLVEGSSDKENEDTKAWKILKEAQKLKSTKEGDK